MPGTTWDTAAGWVSVGIVVHGASPLPGHGPGMTPILTGPRSALVATRGPRWSRRLDGCAAETTVTCGETPASCGRASRRELAAILEHVSLPEAVGRRLRHRILNNELPAGTRLVEANLAAEFGVSRGTIRDAMRDLQSEGLIEIVPTALQHRDPHVDAGR